MTPEAHKQTQHTQVWCEALGDRDDRPSSYVVLKTSRTHCAYRRGHPSAGMAHLLCRIPPRDPSSLMGRQWRAQAGLRTRCAPCIGREATRASQLFSVPVRDLVAYSRSHRCGAVPEFHRIPSSGHARPCATYPTVSRLVDTCTVVRLSTPDLLTGNAAGSGAAGAETRKSAPTPSFTTLYPRQRAHHIRAARTSHRRRNTTTTRTVGPCARPIPRRTIWRPIPRRAPYPHANQLRCRDSTSHALLNSWHFWCASS